MLEAIGAGSQRRVGNKVRGNLLARVSPNRCRRCAQDWADIWAESKELEQVKTDIAAINAEAMATPEEKTPDMELEYATNFPTQLKIVANRTLTAFWRQPDYGFTRLFIHLVVALLTSRPSYCL
jgi:hypothetical protein